MSEAAVPLPLPEEPARDVPARWQADVALVVAAFFFGTTFVVVQDAVETADPLPFIAVRFLIAGAVLWLVGRRRAPTPLERRDGVAAGSALLAGYVLQTVGLQYTSPSTSAFITYLLVVFVPLLSLAVLRRRPHPLTLVGLVIAVAGLVLLTGGAGTSFGRGELLTLGCAVAFAAHLVIVGETAARHDAIRFTCVQVTTVGVASLAASLVSGGIAMSPRAVGAAAFTGVFATALAFFAMVWAQRVVSPSRAALILLLEPVFAAVLAWVTGASLPASALAGGVLILLAVVVAEVLPPWLAARDGVGGKRRGEGPARAGPY
ncbi:MAG TPA: DMT family transporter [Acidimicrobiales bacterium]|jgi:drug/metabolite transporter (DMT)-like permease